MVLRIHATLFCAAKQIQKMFMTCSLSSRQTQSGFPPNIIVPENQFHKNVIKIGNIKGKWNSNIIQQYLYSCLLELIFCQNHQSPNPTVTKLYKK